MNPDPGAPDLSFAALEPMPEITERVIAALPKPEVKLDAACPPIKCLRRSLKDGEVYFFFNESNQTQSRTATLTGNGQVQVWDATHGNKSSPGWRRESGGSVPLVPLTLAPQESTLPVTLVRCRQARASRCRRLGPGACLPNWITIWPVTLGEKQITTSLKSWEEIGITNFSGTGSFHANLQVRRRGGKASGLISIWAMFTKSGVPVI